MIYDITLPVDAKTAVWPGDHAYTIDWTMRKATGATVNVTKLTLSPHTGTHADAFFHCSDEGPGMGEMSLDPYLGKARVLDAPGDGPIDVERLEKLNWKGATRLLFKTRRSRVSDPYAIPFAHLLPAAVDELGKAGVILVGLDTPSMDEFHSKTIGAHHALMRHGIANLENLDLTEVPAGDYELIALPLKLMGVDGSPVRAVLRTVS
ncbi:MAG TPA: cyclase family protein [Candidatus Eisenbacteria bacterium]